MPKCLHVNVVQKYSILSGGKKLPFDKEGKLYYYINNYTQKLSPEYQVSAIEAAFETWNYELFDYDCRFVRTNYKEQAYLNVWFVGGDTGVMPDKPYEDILADPDLIAFCVNNKLWISDLIDWNDGSIDLRVSVEHEIGHSQKIGHTNYDKDIMYPEYIPGNYITGDTKSAIKVIYSSKGYTSIKYYLQIFALLAVLYLLYLLIF